MTTTIDLNKNYPELNKLINSQEYKDYPIMTEVKKVAKWLKENPKAIIYYHDNGGWVIYKSKKDMENEKEVWNCTDYNHNDGYIPFVAAVLAELANIKIVSV